MDIKNMVDKKYKGKSASEIADAPISALHGVSKTHAELLQKSFDIKTVRELASFKFAHWAHNIVTLAEGESKQLGESSDEIKFVGREEFVDFASEVYSRLGDVELGFPILHSLRGSGSMGDSSQEYKFLYRGSIAYARDLHIVFNVPGVTVREVSGARGPFHGHSSKGQAVTLINGKVRPNGDATIDFCSKKYPGFKILRWWWTDGAGVSIGDRAYGPNEYVEKVTETVVPD